MAAEPDQGRILAGRYRLGHVLGAGGHGTVYVAEDLGRGGERVALKLLKGVVGGGTFSEPVAHVLQWFRHPGWADVLETGRAGESDWFQTMRLIEGRSLDRLEGPQPLEEVWAFLEDGARVLRALHALGVIHYDVTPGNFLRVAQEGETRYVLTDGGLANIGPVLGVARGSPMFIAPEVTEDRPHDHRADLYSLGLVAFRLATGRDPFEGAAGDVLGRRRRERAPRASSLRPDLPPPLDDLLDQLLARSPENRPATADEVLRLLGEAKGGPLSPYLAAEAWAATSGGPLAGHGQAMQRFEQTCEVLAELAPMDRQNGNGAASAPLPDPVLLLHGPEGVGATRLAREMAALARSFDVPVLLLAGRDGAPDPADPLAGLLDGLAALGTPDGRVPASPPRPRREADREERAFSGERTIERLVSAIQEAARRLPFVLVVEDVGDLPPLARRAVEVVSRHLLSRSEHGQGVSPPPVVLVADVGAAEVDPFLITDAEAPERPVLRIAPLGRPETLDLVRARFTELAIEDATLAHVEELTELRPGPVLALLAEGVERGDLRAEEGRWAWNASDLTSYQARARLSPSERQALENARPAMRRVLEALALLEGDLPQKAARRIWSAAGHRRLPASRLLVTRGQAGQVGYRLASQGVRLALLAEMDEEVRRERTQTLLDVLGEPVPAHLLVDRARLLAARGREEEALAGLVARADDLSPEQRTQVQAVLKQALDQRPQLLEDAATRSRIAQLLERGPTAVEVAERVARSAPHRGLAPRTALRVADVLEEGQHYEAARKLLAEGVDADAVAPAERVHIQAILAHLHLAARQLDAAREASAVAAMLVDRTPGFAEEHPRVYALYASVGARLAHLAGAYDVAAARLKEARGAARRARDRARLASVLNNSAILAAEGGQFGAALRHFERALRLKRSLGDVRGVVGAMHNLARMYAQHGEALKSTSTASECALLAQRHHLHASHVQALRQLAEAYDRQLRPGHAANVLMRAWRAASRTQATNARLAVAWQLAPLAAALGRLDVTDEMLRTSAHAARHRLTGDARAWHHFAASLAAAHAGHHDRARVAARRALARRNELGPRMEAGAHVLGNLADTSGVRWLDRRLRAATHRTSNYRQNLRTALWLERARRDPDGTPALPRRLRAHDGLAFVLPPGDAGRLLLEQLLAAGLDPGAGVLGTTLERVETLLGRSEAVLLHARTLAALAHSRAGRAPAQAAALLSRALGLLDRCRPGFYRAHALPPPDAIDAARAVAPDAEAGSALLPLHARAHRALLRHGNTDAPDQRVASALKRVLEASATIRTEGGLEALLESLTRHTIEITGAQRACVVLLEEGSELQVRVRTSASSPAADVGVEELSHTVIRRVTTSREPLLLHDVFDDEELLGRPSIANLSLRSILCVPMLRGKNLYGVMYADSTSAVAAFDRVDLEVLSLFAEQAAAAIESGRLLGDLQRSYAELKEAQDRLVRGERLRVIGELSSGVAHEFNNLLTAILARIQMMGLNYLGADVRKDLELVEKAALDAAAVVRRLQTFSRQQRQATFTVVDMSDICTDAVDLLGPLWRGRRRAGRAGVQVKLQTEPGLFVRGDPTELREVLTNLIKNAVDSLEDGGQVLVRAARRQGRIRVRVQDDGIGIPPDILPKIFDPFFTTKGERGTGLGLCLAQQIVERHGGQVKVESERGKGTSVTFSLPSAESPKARDLPAAPPGEAPTAALRVVVVDDDDDVLKPLCSYLQRSGYDVRAASDGNEGLAAITDHHPDVVLTDIGMPGIDGIELCRRVHEKAPHLPIVLMSGWASDVDPVRARAAGARALLAKPFAMQQVRDLLADVAKRS